MIEGQGSSSAERPRMKGDDEPRGNPVAASSDSPSTHRNAPLLGIVLSLALLIAAMAFAIRQAPHPDMLRAVSNWDVGNPAWWAYPLERNAFKRNLIRGHLRDAFRLPGTELVWAVGEGGLILHSRDGGDSWTQQHPEPPRRAETAGFSLIGAAHAADAPDAKKAYTPPAKAPVQQAPQEQIKLPASAETNSLPPTNRAAVNIEGRRAVPITPGKEQQAFSLGKVPPPVDPEKADLAAVYFIDEEQGWAVGGGGAVLVTEDGGESWGVVDVEVTYDLGGVVFSADGKRGWIFPARRFGKTTGPTRVSVDGGRSWADSSLSSLSMLDAQPRLGSDRNSITLRGNATGLLRRGGVETWLIEASQSGSRLMREKGRNREEEVVATWPDFRANALQVSEDGNRIVLVGERGMIRYSTDAGAKWQDVTAVGGDLYGLQCDDALDDCLVTGDNGTVLRGSALTSWRRVTPGTGANLLWAQFKDGGTQGDAISSNNIQFATHDGGASWYPLAQVTLPPDAARNSAMKFVDGNYQWRVGPLGNAERSEDGGKTWRKSFTGTQAWLTSVHFLADHQRGWLAGDDGHIFVTRDGGASWQQQTTPTRNWLWHISMNADGKSGRALGAYGTVLLTSDGGARWQEAADYARYPAPWFWLVLLACGVALIVLVPAHLRSRNQQLAQTGNEGAASTFDADQPVTHISQDRLGYRPAIEALANFLRNSATEPRITLAITGEWGSGKSSMMRMLQTEMAAKGYRTAWFNAWHHQQEGRQLTALFNVVRRHAVPRLFRQPLAWLRVRSRLIWGRSAFYRVVCIAVPLFALVALGDFSLQPDRTERLKWWLGHQFLQWERVVITDKSIEKLKPVATRTVTETSGGKTTTTTDSPAPVEQSAAANDKGNIANPVGPLALTQRSPLRPEVLNFIKSSLVWESGNNRRCGDKRNIAEEDRCVFKNTSQLLLTIEQRSGPLWPSEREAVLKAVEQIPVKPLFPALEQFIVPLLGIFTLLFTRGMTVYGLQILGPLQNLLGAKSDGGGKEAAGSIEHYRREFCLLTEALDGRLLIFIDDIDRCNPETVNSIMELTNYLVDVGRCFVVLGMAMERVKASIEAPKGAEADYADKYLRKLVHIELPVPIASAQESLGLFIQRAKAKDETEAQKEAKRRWLAQWWAMLRPWLVRVGVLVGVLLVAGSAIEVGRKLNNYRQPPALKIGELDRSIAATQAGAADDTTDAATPADATPDLASGVPVTINTSGDVGLNAPAPTRMPWLWLGMGGAILLAGLAIRSSRVLQERVLIALGSAVRTKDSDNFRAALQIWLDAVRLHDNTPRGIKRFCNRARLLAIYEKEDVESLQEEGQTSLVAIPDVHVVALAAIHHVSPKLLQTLDTSTPDVDKLDWATLGNLDALRNAHTERFGWPDNEAIRRFKERVERIAVR